MENKDNIEWKTPEFDHGISVLVYSKPLDKIICKAVEELNELSVKLLQYVNKPESISEGDIEEEIADVEMNLELIGKFFPVSSNIRNQKITKFLKCKDYNFYLDKYNKMNVNNILENEIFQTDN